MRNKLKDAYSKCMACGGKMKKGMNGMSVPRLQGSVVASTPMAKKGQSFAAKNAAKGRNLKDKAKANLRKK
jgi:predicted nucleic acid-binding Zn ribbon protein